MTSWTAPPRGGVNLAGTSRSGDMCKQTSFQFCCFSFVVSESSPAQGYLSLFYGSAQCQWARPDPSLPQKQIGRQGPSRRPQPKLPVPAYLGCNQVSGDKTSHSHRLIHQESLGVAAFNDSILLEASVYNIIDRHFAQLDCYPSLLREFHNVSSLFCKSFGDLWKSLYALNATNNRWFGFIQYSSLKVCQLSGLEWFQVRDVPWVATTMTIVLLACSNFKFILIKSWNHGYRIIHLLSSESSFIVSGSQSHCCGSESRSAHFDAQGRKIGPRFVRHESVQPHRQVQDCLLLVCVTGWARNETRECNHCKVPLYKEEKW